MLRLFSALFLALAAASSSATKPSKPLSIEYKFTVRDFVQAICMKKASLEKYFTGCSSSGQKNCWSKNSWDNDRDNECGWDTKWDEKGLLGLAHPDFEIDGNVYPNAVLKGIVNETLFTEHDGIPKPIYCRNSDAKPWCGAKTKDGVTRYATTGKSTFDQWYRDTPQVNKRVGITIELDLDESIGENVYVFAAGKSTGFFPLTQNNFVPPQVWPYTIRETQVGQQYYGGKEMNFWFTTEHHSYFQYTGGEVFTFKGDDDVFVFINGHLEVDIGGLHPSATGSINLDSLKHSNLTVGGVYALDIFHAERHTHASNFRIETSLAKVCNVVESGSNAFEASPDNGNEIEFIGASMKEKSNEIELTKGEQKARTGYAWAKAQHNVGTGFIARFSFKMTEHRNGGGDGISFIIQRHGINNLNGGSGGALGIDGITRSIAVVIDTCADRANPAASTDRTCSLQQVRIHSNGLGPNNAYDDTRKVWTNVGIDLKDGKEHHVVVQYLMTPSWIEVYIDDSLYLTMREYANIEDMIGGRNAYIGFAGTTSWEYGSTHTITSWSIDTVSIASGNTMLLPSKQNNTYADNKTTVSFAIQTYDFCGLEIHYGGYGQWVEAKLTSTAECSSLSDAECTSSQVCGLSSRKLCVPHTVEAVIADNDDGTYDCIFATDVVSKYTLSVSFNGTAIDSDRGLPQGASVNFVTPPEAPPDEGSSGFSTAAYVGVAGGGGLALVGAILLTLYFVRLRKKWLREAHLRELGREAENNDIELQKTEYDDLARKHYDAMMRRQELEQKATSNPAERRKLAKLKSQNEQMRLEILRQKKTQQISTNASPSHLAKPSRKPRKKHEFGASMPYEAD